MAGRSDLGCGYGLSVTLGGFVMHERLRQTLDSSANYCGLFY